MFKKWLSPESDSGGSGETNQPVTGEILPGQSQTPPPAGNSAEEMLKAAKVEAERWKNGYAGLQKTLGKKDIELEKLTKQLEETNSGLSTLQQTHTSVQTEHQSLTQKAEELELNLNATQSQLQRAKIIMGKFPHLASWEADNSLPETPVDAKEEDVIKLFQSFSDKLAAATKSANINAGGGPPPPAGNGGGSTSADEELKLAKDAASHGKLDEYSAHYNKYLELSKPKM
jgi:DNA repair exonuclease SbcCD ATPase subunit